MAVNPDTIIYPKASEDPKAQELLDSPEQLAILDARLEFWNCAAIGHFRCN